VYQKVLQEKVLLRTLVPSAKEGTVTNLLPKMFSLSVQNNHSFWECFLSELLNIAQKDH